MNKHEGIQKDRVFFKDLVEGETYEWVNEKLNATKKFKLILKDHKLTQSIGECMFKKDKEWMIIRYTDTGILDYASYGDYGLLPYDSFFFGMRLITLAKFKKQRAK